MKEEFVTVLQGKAVREFAQRLVTGNYTIERQSLNRYKVIEGVNSPEQSYTLINRRSFVLLDKEIYKLQSRENPLSACIEIALNNDALHFCVRKSSIDAMSFKLITRTFAQAKVTIVDVSTYQDNYIIRFELIESVSERSLTEKEQAIAAMFQRAEEVNLDIETVDTTAKTVETIPTK